MTTEVSPQIKLFALVGLIGALALAGFMFFVVRPGAAPAPVEPLPVTKPVKASVLPSPAKAKAKAAVTAKAVAKPKAAPPAKAKPAPANAKPKAAPAEPKAAHKAKPKPVIAKNGLPTVVVEALARDRVVVVALHTGRAEIDDVVVAEARAGARDAHAGFLALNVLDRRVAEALALKTRVLHAPAVLVFQRPGDVVTTLDSFADRLTVAQAAQSARP